MSLDSTLEMSELKSSNDILNELFSTFNTSFDEELRKKKKSKKSKSKDKKDSGGDEDVRKVRKKTKDKEKIDKGALKSKEKEKEKKKKKKTKDSNGEVDELIHKHRKKIKSEFKGLVSNIGDIVIKNDDLIRSKTKKTENDLRRAAEKSGDFEDGEILEEDKTSLKKLKERKPPALSASQAYKLDMEEKVLLRMEPSHSRKSMTKSEDSRERRHSSGKHEEHHKDKRRSTSRVLEEGAKIRHAPPRPKSRTPSPEERRKDYKDMKWEKERGHYESESYSRRRDRDYDLGNYYEKETYRRSDGRSGFGFSRSYFDERADYGERKGYHSHDDRERRGRSRSPSTRHRSFRRSRSRSPRWRRSRSRSRERSSRRRHHPDDIIDKAKLLEIARANAAKLMSRGVMPSDIFSQDQIFAIRAGGKSVEELTEYCKKLAKKDARGEAVFDDDDLEDHFIHHPFNVKDKPLPQITFNIRNAIPIPVRTPHEMAIESAKLKNVFPVSSGTSHRIKELEWHPVIPEEEEKKAKAASQSLVPLDGPKVNAVAPMARDESDVDKEKSKSVEKKEIPKSANFDISDCIAIRLKAMRQLSENPNCDEAKKQLDQATQMMKEWADAKALDPKPVAEVKSLALEPKFLTQSELTQGPQAWAKRDQLVKAKEVQSPMGQHLLQKMGWRPGEGLGKTKSGDIEPLALEVKTDKKGLTSVLDFKKGPAMPVVYDLSGKHPISALMELCAKRRWGAPEFDLVFEHGPAHLKQFVYKVVVNGVEYQPCIAVNNKKLAKANAAAFCLQSLGLLPTAKQIEPTTSLQTVENIASTPVDPVQSFGTFVQTGQYLQTVASTPLPCIQPQPPPPPAPSLPEHVLMPPPPPPPPLIIKKTGT